MKLITCVLLIEFPVLLYKAARSIKTNPLEMESREKSTGNWPGLRGALLMFVRFTPMSAARSFTTIQP